AIQSSTTPLRPAPDPSVVTGQRGTFTPGVSGAPLNSSSTGLNSSPGLNPSPTSLNSGSPGTFGADNGPSRTSLGGTPVQPRVSAPVLTNGTPSGASVTPNVVSGSSSSPAGMTPPT